MKHHHMDLGIDGHRKELISDIDAMANEQGEPFGLIILDNWTSLISSIDENDNSKLTPIKQWLIKLRLFGLRHPAGVLFRTYWSARHGLTFISHCSILRNKSLGAEHGQPKRSLEGTGRRVWQGGPPPR